MNAVPAKAAGVRRLALVTPLRAGVIDPAVAAAVLETGVDEVWGIGGAHAIAALAYGAEPIRRVDKIVGPGNAYVTAAKRLVYGQVGIDALAGPSEILVIADGRNDPDWIAADLLSQAEHDPDAQAVLITDDDAFADAVAAAVEALLGEPQTAEQARASWRAHGAIITVTDLLADAPALSDRLAPEHVEIAAEQAEDIAAALRHAGSVFIGRHAPEALGDYVTGANHVLPTAGAARFSSGLGMLDFMKRTSIQRIGPEGFAALAGPAAILAHAEGLPAHARSVEVRQAKS
jgi:histidinol dehydrogenase